jgi:hypothetical protein
MDTYPQCQPSGVRLILDAFVIKNFSVDKDSFQRFVS